MKQAIDAIYENGTFKPIHLDQIDLTDGQLVTLIVEDNVLPEPLRLAACVYEGLSEQEIDEVEHIAKDRELSRQEALTRLAEIRINFGSKPMTDREETNARR